MFVDHCIKCDEDVSVFLNKLNFQTSIKSRFIVRPLSRYMDFYIHDIREGWTKRLVMKIFIIGLPETCRNVFQSRMLYSPRRRWLQWLLSQNHELGERSEERSYGMKTRRIAFS